MRPTPSVACDGKPRRKRCPHPLVAASALLCLPFLPCSACHNLIAGAIRGAGYQKSIRPLLPLIPPAPIAGACSGILRSAPRWAGRVTGVALSRTRSSTLTSMALKPRPRGRLRLHRTWTRSETRRSREGVTRGSMSSTARAS